jgi:glycerol-3-phosphate dehydrogenase
LPGGNDFNRPEAIRKFGRLYEKPVLEALMDRYGKLALAVLELDVAPEIFRGANGEPYTSAEFIYHMRYSHAKKLSDLFLRRTGLGTTGLPAESVTRAIAGLVAREAGWDKKKKEQELKELQLHYELCR